MVQGLLPVRHLAPWGHGENARTFYSFISFKKSSHIPLILIKVF